MPQADAEPFEEAGGSGAQPMCSEAEAPPPRPSGGRPARGWADWAAA